MEEFTKREIEVLKYVMKGYSNKEIGDILGLTFHTVKSHVSKMLHKTGLMLT